MNGKELNIVKSELNKFQLNVTEQIAKIKTRQEERDKTLFVQLGNMNIKFDKQIKNHQDNAVAIGVINEKTKSNNKLVWIFFIGIMMVVFAIVAGSIAGFLPVKV